MVIITGANGFVGQHLVPRALKYFKRSEIICLISEKMRDPSLETRGKRVLKKNGLRTLKVDLVTGKGLDKLPKHPRLVIHLAANTDTSITDHKVNDIGTKNLIKALSLNNKAHIIYTSTTALMSGRSNCSKQFNEQATPIPSNEYSRSKLRAEKFLKESCRKDKFNLTIVRLNTVYGGDPRKRKMFQALKEYILKGSFITRLNWPGKTGVIHVDDVVSALLNLAKKPPQGNKVQLLLLNAENLSLSEISQIMHYKMGIYYKPINLPKLFWMLCSFGRKFLPLIEKLTTPSFYNLIWRVSLIVDNVIYCKSNKISKVLPKWKPRKMISVSDF